MSKKRVHEIAKELKGHGIDLDNKEVVTELLSFGYDVKSHSSSLEDDQANEAVRKIVDKRKPKAAPAPIAPKGFMVRRKMGPDTSIPTTVAPPAPPPPLPLPLPPVAEVIPAATQAGASDFAPVTVAAPSAPRALPVSDAAPVVAEPLALPPAPVPVEAIPVAHVSAPRIAATRASAPRVAAVAMAAPTATVTVSVPVGPPGLAVPPTLRHSVTMGPRASAPRPGGTVVTTRPPVQQNQRPTATQAVVISRPLIQVKRVTPSSTAHKSFPMAPGRKAIGEVKEFKVVSDHLGRGRELVDVSKNKEKERQKGRGRTPEKEGTPSQADMRELVFGRIAIPLRGKKKKPTKKGQKTIISPSGVWP